MPYTAAIAPVPDLDELAKIFIFVRPRTEHKDAYAHCRITNMGLGKGLSMTKVVSFVACMGAFGLALAFFLLTPVNGPVEAREDAAAANCRSIEVALDEGYSVSRVVIQRVCD